MSDKLQEDFNIYYLELKNFTENFKTSSQAVETDKLLSRAGKFEQVEKIKVEHLKSVSDLSERFTADFGKRLENLDDRVNDVKYDSILDAIKKKYSKGESLSGDETNRLLLHEMLETKDIMRKSSFQNMLSTADIQQLRKTSHTLADSKDIERLEWLRELSVLRGDEVLSNMVRAQVDAVRDSQMSDEQRNLQEVAKRIQKGVKLFQYSLERSKRGDFIDARNTEV